MSESSAANRSVEGNRLFMFNLLKQSKDKEIKRLYAEVLTHPYVHLTNKASLYAHIYNTLPGSPAISSTATPTKRKRHRDALYEMLDVLDVITYGKEGVRNSNYLSIQTPLDTAPCTLYIPNLGEQIPASPKQPPPKF